LKASNRALCLLALLAGLACRSANPSMGELRQALAAGEAARAKVAPAQTLQREIAFAGPPVAHAGEQRRRQVQALLELLAPELLPAAQTGTPSAAPDASLDAATDAETAAAIKAAAATASGPTTGALAQSATVAETSAATGAAASPATASVASAPAEPANGASAAVASGDSTAALTNAHIEALASAQAAAPTAAIPEAQASGLPLALALREQTIGSGRLLALGPLGGRRVLLRAAESQRAALEPRLLLGLQRLAAGLEALGGGPLNFELALYLGPVDANARAALRAQPCSAEFVLALSAEQRPAGAVPLLVRGRDPGLLQPLAPDSGASARFLGALGELPGRTPPQPSADAALASGGGEVDPAASAGAANLAASLAANADILGGNASADHLGTGHGAHPSGAGHGAVQSSGGNGSDLLGDSNGAALWLRQAWLDLFAPLGPLASGEVAVDPALCFGPSLVTAAPTVGFCWGPHGELADDTALGLDPRRAESAALLAVFLAAWSLADPDAVEFKRALDSLNAERELRSESARSAGAERLESEWLVALEGARSWLRRTCFDLPADDARSVLLAAPAADPAN
jgi:hypothetical protein